MQVLWKTASTLWNERGGLLHLHNINGKEGDSIKIRIDALPAVCIISADTDQENDDRQITVQSLFQNKQNICTVAKCLHQLYYWVILRV